VMFPSVLGCLGGNALTCDPILFWLGVGIVIGILILGAFILR